VMFSGNQGSNYSQMFWYFILLYNIMRLCGINHEIAFYLKLIENCSILEFAQTREIHTTGSMIGQKTDTSNTSERFRYVVPIYHFDMWMIQKYGSITR